jgi:hypothetical protein
MKTTHKNTLKKSFYHKSRRDFLRVKRKLNDIIRSLNNRKANLSYDEVNELKIDIFFIKLQLNQYHFYPNRKK